MKINKISLLSEQFPEKLKNISDPPQALFVSGASLEELLARPAVAIIGSRKVSAYGQTVTARLSAELARAGVVIISGLAIGVDGIAHRAALEAGGLTVAVLPTGLEQVYPGSHHRLATEIVEKGGALVSEYSPESPIYKTNFIARNRIVSGLSDAVLITEATEKSGTLHTADFALQQGKEVLAVPGNITSPTSVGTNHLIKTGATPVTSVKDILQVLGLDQTTKNRQAPKSSNPQEQLLLDMLFSGVEDGAKLLLQSQLDVSQFNQTLTMLEIRGHIRALGNNRWALQ